MSDTKTLIPITLPSLGEAEAQAAYDAVLSGWVTQGPRVKQFEDNFAQYVGAPHATAVSNATTGLHLAMVILGVGPGDEVICPSMSYIATANCIRYTGAHPVLAEVDRRTFNLDPQDTERRITERTKAILVVHQIGLPADLDAFQALGQKYNLPVVEDAACAIGSEYKGRHIGAADQSEMVVFSFHPRKVLTTGDGGMVTTRNPEYDRMLKLLRQHGMGVTDRARHEANITGKVILPDHLVLGYNYRMTDIQAAVGIEQLRRLPALMEDRHRQGARYFQGLAGLPGVVLPHVPEGCSHNWQSFALYLEPGVARIDRDTFMTQMLAHGVATRSGIMTSHRETAWQDYEPGLSLPVSEDACDNSVLIPLYNGLSGTQQDEVIRAIRTLLA